jgi:hypothetical protein
LKNTLTEYYQGLVSLHKQDKRGKNLKVPYCLNNIGLSELCIDINGEKPQVHETVLPKGLSLHVLHMDDDIKAISSAMCVHMV